MTLTIALQRSDRTEALFSGRLGVAGFDVEFLNPPVSDMFDRMLREQAFAASEMSFAYGLMVHGRGDPPLVTLPVYPSRNFRHSSLFVLADSPLHSLGDLAGKTFAVHDFFAADPLWLRGNVREHFGVDPRDIRWLQYAFRDRVPLPTLAGYELDYAIGADPTDLLLNSRADVVFAPEWPRPLRNSGTEIRPLFDDPVSVEQAYFRQTGILPPLHGLVMRRDVYQEYPGLALALYRALVASRDAWYRDLYTAPSVLSGLPFFTSLTLRVKQTMGHDFWPYGLAANRVAVETGIRHAVADGLLSAPFSADELFPLEFRDT